MSPEPKKMLKPPYNATGNTVIYNYHDVADETGNPHRSIIVGEKIYTLQDWNSDTLEVIYTQKEPATMNQPATPATPDRMTAAELRSEFESLQHEIDDIRSSLVQISEGLTHAATASANASSSSAQVMEFTMDAISLDFVDGKPVYKARGGRYIKFGIRIWPEVLPALGINPGELQPGSNAIAPLDVRVELTAEGQPRKVIGLAHG